MTCSAYSSYFILDKDTKEAMFSPFGTDSMPRELNTEKDAHGIAQKVDKKVWKQKQYIIPMKLVPPAKVDAPAPDSLSADSVSTDFEKVESLDDIQPVPENKPTPETPKEDINLDDDSIWDDEDE